MHCLDMVKKSDGEDIDMFKEDVGTVHGVDMNMQLPEIYGRSVE